MPVISKQSKIIKGEKITQKFEFTVMYSQTEAFYVVLPEQFLTTLQTVSHDTCKHFSISLARRGNSISYIVSDQSEQGVIEKFCKAVKKLIDTNVIQRDVIIVFFKIDGGSRYNGHVFNLEHDKKSAQFGLTYAIETTSGDGEKLYRFREVGKTWNMDKREYENHETGRQEDFSIWKHDSTIIDDTPENRQKLDSLYLGLQNLYAAIGEITKSPEMLEAFVQSDVKLLG